MIILAASLLMLSSLTGVVLATRPSKVRVQGAPIKVETRPLSSLWSALDDVF